MLVFGGGGLLSIGGSNFSVSARVLHMDVISNSGTLKKKKMFYKHILFIRCLNWIIFSFMKNNKNKLLEEHLESGIFTNLQKHYI